MKKVVIIIFVLAGTLTGIIFLGYTYVVGSYWELLYQKESPDRTYGISVYRNNADYDRHAPYGYYIYLEGDISSQREDADLIFAGYCETEPRVHWDQPHLISIACATNDVNTVNTLMQRIYGIGIELNIQ